MRIVVSVTSYRRRLNVLLPEALKSVINQNVKPDLVVVYVTETDYSNIDNGKFGIDGVEFRVVPDYMSYKKYWALSGKRV